MDTLTVRNDPDSREIAMADALIFPNIYQHTPRHDDVSSVPMIRIRSASLT